MAKTVTVSAQAIRDLVREALNNKDIAEFVARDEGPVTVNHVVDPSAAATDPINPNFTPQSKAEFDVAVDQLVKDLPDEKMPGLYAAVKAVFDAEAEKDEQKTAGVSHAQDAEKDYDNKVEEAIRMQVRRILESDEKETCNNCGKDLPPNWPSNFCNSTCEREDVMKRRPKHDCTKCYRSIPTGTEVEVFGVLYHPQCAPKRRRRK